MRPTMPIIALLCAAGAAHAGGVVEQPVAPVVPVTPPPEPPQEWTGPYVGLQYDHILDGTLDQNGDIEEFDGHLYGIFAGYRHDFGDFVVGGEIDYMVGELDFDGDVEDVDSLLRLGGEFGFDAGRILPYGTIGYAWLDVDGSEFDGLFYGAGVDYLLTERFTIGAELLQHNLDDGAGTDVDVTTIGINAAFQF